MRLLALDTATDACSVALNTGGETLTRSSYEPRQHARLVLEMIDAVLAEGGLTVSRLDGIAYGCGPGSFTGLRIAAGITQGLAFGADLGAVPVSDLAALAQGVVRQTRHEHVIAALDARMGEVYWGCFTRAADGHVRAAGPERLSHPREVRWPQPAHWFGAGPGWTVIGVPADPSLELQGCDPARLPHAADVLTLALPALAAGRTVPPEEVVPRYLRAEVARPERPREV